MNGPPGLASRRAVGRAELVARLAETWVRRPSTPNRVVMMLTRACNLRCNMCLTWSARPERPPMTPEQVGGVLRQIDRLTWLDLTGGEIFVRPDAEAVFDEVTRATPALRMLHFPTNGWFGDRVERVASDFVARRPESDLIITVSLDGPRDVHDRIRGRAGSFDRAIATFRRLRELPGVSVFVGTTITSASQPHVDALGEYLHGEIPGFSAREWHWNWLQESGHFFRNTGSELQPDRSEPIVRTHVARRGLPRSPVELMELGFLVTLERYLRGEPTGISCQSLRSTCFISPEGDLYPCHVWDRPLGSLLESPFAALWAADETTAARREVERLDCGGCFTPCEAYPALAGSPLAASRSTLRGIARQLRRSEA